MIAVALVGLVLVQRSEGGALGIGGGGGGFMSGRGAANLLTRMTAILAVCVFHDQHSPDRACASRQRAALDHRSGRRCRAAGRACGEWRVGLAEAGTAPARARAACSAERTASATVAISSRP